MMVDKSERDERFLNAGLNNDYKEDSPKSLRDTHSGHTLLVPNLPPKRTSNLEAIMEIDEAADRPLIKTKDPSEHEENNSSSFLPILSLSNEPQIRRAQTK